MVVGGRAAAPPPSGRVRRRTAVHLRDRGPQAAHRARRRGRARLRRRRRRRPRAGCPPTRACSCAIRPPRPTRPAWPWPRCPSRATPARSSAACARRSCSSAGGWTPRRRCSTPRARPAGWTSSGCASTSARTRSSSASAPTSSAAAARRRRRCGSAPDHEVAGYAPYERLREAALAAGAEPAGDGHPGIEDALRRFGPMATPEVAAVCDLPGPRAPAELWRLALEWRVRPRRVLGGELWELA